MDDGPQALRLRNGQGHRLVQGHRLENVGGVDVPGVEHPGHVLVGQQAVHGFGGKFPTGFFVDKGDDFAPVVQGSADKAVFHHRAVRCQHGAGGQRFVHRRSVAGNDTHRAAGGHGDLSPYAVRGRLHGYGQAVAGFRAFRVFLRQTHQADAGEGQGIEHGNPFASRQGVQRIRLDGFRFPDDPGVIPPGVFIDPGDGGAGQNIVELIQQQLFPGRVHALEGIGRAVEQRHSPPHFRLPQGQLRLAVALFDGRLRGIHAPVGGEIQFAHIGVLGAALFLHVLEELDRPFHLHPGHPLQILFALQKFDVIPGRPAAAVAVAVGQQEGVQAPLLHPLLPDLRDLPGIGLVGVAGGQEGVDLGAVRPLPGEIVIGETLAAVVAPENLLSNQVFDPRALQNLRQGGGIAEGVRKPQHHGFHAEIFLEIPLAVDQLPHQGFAAGHVGVRFHPHGPFRDPLSFFGRLLDAGEQFGIVLPAHFISGRLALEILVFRVLLNQAKLLGKGAAGLPAGFRHGPQPGQVQMSIAHGVEGGHGGAVHGLQNGLQRFPRRPVGGVSGLRGLFKIHDQRGPLQGLRDGIRPQAVLHHLIAQQTQGFQIHIELIGVLIPNAEGHVAQGGARPRPVESGKFPRPHRAGGAGVVLPFGVIVARVGFDQQIVGVSRFSAAGQRIIFNIMMGDRHPFGPPGAEGQAVHKHGGFAAGLQIHDDPFSFRFLGQRDLPPQPAVFPGFSPGRAGGNGLEHLPAGFLGRQIIHGEKRFQRDAA